MILALLLYSQILFFELTGCDDKMLLNDAKSFLQNKSLSGVLTAPYLFQNALFYRPVVNISFTLPLLLGLESTSIQYVVNILIHAVNSLLLFGLLKRLGIGNNASVFLTLLFVVHPVCTNSVAWLPGRNDSLLTLFLLISILYYDRYLENGKYKYIGLNITFFLVSLFTKETALAALIVYVVYFYLKKSKKISSLVYSAAGWVVSIVLWHIIRMQFVQGSDEVEYYKNLLFIIQAIGKSVLPFNMSVLPTIKDTTYVYGIISILLLFFLILITKKRNPGLILFGVVWFFTFLLPPLLNINPEYNQNLMLESRLYLPLIGILILISQIKLPVRQNIRGLRYLAAVVAILLFCYLNFKAASSYRNVDVFWENAVSNSPTLDLSFSGLGLINLQRQNYQKAADCYKQASVLNPRKLDYNKKAGFCFLNLNNTDKAEEYFRRELTLNPDDYDSNLLGGIICFKTGKLEEAEKMLLSAYRINKKDFQPPLYLLKLYHQQKNYVEAFKYANILKEAGYKIPDEIAKDLNYY